MAMEPSPTADATRFTAPWRTSPAANTPGMLDSRRNGLRSRGHARRRGTSAPVRTNPCSSRSTSAGSQSVLGWAPISRKSAFASTAASVSRPGVAQHQVLEPAVAAAAHHLAAESGLDVVGRLDLTSEVLGHPGAERIGPHHERDGAGVAGEVQRGLPRRVGASDDEDVATRVCRCLGCRTPVEHARPDQRLQRRHVEPAIPGAHRQDHRGAAHRAAVGQRDHELAPVTREPGDRLHEHELRPEHPRLVVRALGQLPAADAAREPEVVPDERARRGLAADAALVDHQRAEPFRGAVHRGRQARGTGPDDDDVEVHPLGVDGTAGGHGHLGVARVLEDVPLGNTTSGSLAPSGAAATSARPSSESARQKLCTIAHCLSASRSS